MSAHDDLKSIYLGELKDLWSANDQMRAVVTDMAAAANDPALAQRLTQSAEEIAAHTATLMKSMIHAAGGDREKHHCKGMEGLVQEARRHALDAEFADGELSDVAIIAQYQRMAHYGMAGVGTAAACARALGRTEDADQLQAVLDDVYSADRHLSDLAERCVNLEAA